MTTFRDYVILIPHQFPPKVVDPELCPPDREAGDELAARDHDMHSAHTVGDWLDYPHVRGHQRPAVNELVRRLALDLQDCGDPQAIEYFAVAK